jgi:predicted DNA-binding protein
LLKKLSTSRRVECVQKVRPKHEGQIGFRLPRELRERLDRIHERHLTSDAGVFRALAEAFCTEVEKQQRVALPLKIQLAEADSSDAAGQSATNESSSENASMTRKSNRPAAAKK